MQYCFVIPHFNHADQLERFLPTLRQSKISCIIVDDGSHLEAFNALQRITDGADSLHLLRQPTNRGKGAAVITGCYYARSLGFTHAIQIDADGQHQPGDAERFIALSRSHPTAIISGLPQFNDSAPAARRYGRKISTFWTNLETLSLDIKDALCGFRIYPLDTVEHLVDHYHIGARMDFDTDILVKSKWSGFPLLYIETEVHYLDAGVSHFHYLRDNLRLIALHVRLLAQAPLRLIGRFMRKPQPTSSAQS